MKQDRIEIRSSHSERNKFEEAAVVLGMNLSSFIRMAALEKSSAILKDHTNTILLSNEDRDLFLKALEEPPKLNKSMESAIKKHAKIKYGK